MNEIKKMLENEKKLTEYAKMYGTDKLGHGYIPFYAKYLPTKIQSMCEIGVWHGASANMWNSYYDARPDIHLIDIFMEEGNMTPRECRKLGFIPWKGSQIDMAFLGDIKAKFDFIIEDGSHNSYDMIASFKHMFLANLDKGGIWVTEDLHTCTDTFYWGGKPEFKSVDDTMLGLAKKYIATGKIDNPFFNEGESEVFESLIDKMELVAEDKLLFIWRK